jgi:hypothetical protein
MRRAKENVDTDEACKGERGHVQQQMIRAVGDGESMSTSTVHEHWNL